MVAIVTLGINVCVTSQVTILYVVSEGSLRNRSYIKDIGLKFIRLLKRGTVMLENLTHVGAKLVGIKNLRLELKN